MSREPSTFFTTERRQILEDLIGPLTDVDEILLETVGEYAAKELWANYEAINTDEQAFLSTIAPLIDPGQAAFRGSFLPADAGGIGASVPAYMMGLEMIAQGNASTALSLLIDGSVLNAVWNLGDEGQKKRYVRDAMDNIEMTAFGLTEPGHGSDAGNLRTKARRDGDTFIINGTKNWITNGGWAKHYFLVSRTHEDASLGAQGLSVIMVDKSEISDIRQIPKYTVPGSYTAELEFADALVPVNDGVMRMLGEENRGFLEAKKLLEGGRVTVAAFGLGIATEALEMGFDYAMERESKGRPLIENQGISFPFAQYDAELDAARLLTYCAAKRMQEGEMDYAEASKAKLLANDLAKNLTIFNREVHASYGLAKEYRCMQLFHDAGVGITGEGTAEVQKILIASSRKRRSRK